MFRLLVPSHLNSRFKRSTSASIEFERAFGREPEPGDLLRYADTELNHCAAIRELQYGPFIEARRRQLPETQCPLKLEDGRLFRRINQKLKTAPPRPRVPADAGFDWEEATDTYPEEHWRMVEMKAFEDFARAHKIMQLATLPHTSAVVFLGVVDGEHRCRPATDAENLAGK